MYKLYYNPGTASMCVHQALIETQAPYTLELVDFAAGGQRDAAYLQLNPGGVVPTLLIDGVPYVESAALLMTLATRHPEVRLAPPEGSDLRAAWHQWIVYLANALLPAYRLWFYPQDLTAEAALQEQLKGPLRARIETILTHIDAHLTTRGPYLLGDTHSVADILLIMLLRWSRNMPKPATTWPALAKYVALITARPSWRKLCEMENLTGWPPAP